MTDYLKQAAHFVGQGLGGFSMPRLSDWRVTGTGGTTASLDVADVGTLGATYVVPINVNVSAGSTEIALYHREANLPVIMEGWGGGGGVALGWSAAPVSGSYAGGKLGNVGPGIDFPSGGIGALIAGPKANTSVLSPADLEGFMTIGGAELSFAVNGLTFGVVMFADRPILKALDMIFLKAFGLVWGFQFVGGSVSAGMNGMVFSCRVRDSSLAFPGAKFGACIAPA